MSIRSLLSSASWCAICAGAVDWDASAEHVIPNAIGGRLKVKGFICRRCNSVAGHSWDAALAAQLNPLCMLFEIVRERGAPPPLMVNTTAGERLSIRSDFSLALAQPDVSIRPSSAGTSVSITARSTQEARQILTQLKAKYPAIDVEAQLAAARDVYSPAAGMIQLALEMGGDVAGRSIVKSALAIAARLARLEAATTPASRVIVVDGPTEFDVDAELLARGIVVSDNDLVVRLADRVHLPISITVDGRVVEVVVPDDP